MVDLAQTRTPVVLGAGLERRGVEGVDRGTVGGSEGQMEVGGGRLAVLMDEEGGLLVLAESADVGPGSISSVTPSGARAFS